MRLANWEGREGEEEALSGFEVLALNNMLKAFCILSSFQ